MGSKREDLERGREGRYSIGEVISKHKVGDVRKRSEGSVKRFVESTAKSEMGERKEMSDVWHLRGEV